jgi:tRNA(fMet)-specific endonuclease VapC
MYLLDTNILVYAQKKKSLQVIQNIERNDPEQLFISVFTVAEMVFGCKKSLSPETNHRALLEFLLPFNVIGFEQSDCDTYGTIRSFLEKNGKPIGTIDTFIGSLAVSRGMVLVTNNTREFERIPGIILENWAL